ncbi:hypothetical protein [Lysinibacillus sp. BPa_S21]|nr:hypothetical protein [Lysinibacillus sp. BPa_S21]MCL1698010.1 hypothetical protein [Lysinibacillus sp. BPa_S21]MCL1703000.1 hypothetical protein [Lysinibacillus sp. Bpr_S20]
MKEAGRRKEEPKRRKEIRAMDRTVEVTEERGRATERIFKVTEKSQPDG